MLVLGRKVNERIRIGDNIIITLVEVRDGYKAKIGIEAPGDVVVDREEVWQAKQRTKQTRP